MWRRRLVGQLVADDLPPHYVVHFRPAVSPLRAVGYESSRRHGASVRVWQPPLSSEALDACADGAATAFASDDAHASHPNIAHLNMNSSHWASCSNAPAFGSGRSPLSSVTAATDKDTSACSDATRSHPDVEHDLPQSGHEHPSQLAPAGVNAASAHVKEDDVGTLAHDRHGLTTSAATRPDSEANAPPAVLLGRAGIDILASLDGCNSSKLVAKSFTCGRESSQKSHQTQACHDFQHQGEDLIKRKEVSCGAHGLNRRGSGSGGNSDTSAVGLHRKVSEHAKQQQVSQRLSRLLSATVTFRDVQFITREATATPKVMAAMSGIRNAISLHVTMPIRSPLKVHGCVN
jgi:hypothetical protein